MSANLYIARDSDSGPMQYAMSTGKPKRHWDQFFVKGDPKSTRQELFNEVAEAIVGRELKVGDCVEIVSCGVVEYAV